MKKVFMIWVLVILFIPCLTQAIQGLTIEERLIRLETRVEEGFKALNQRIDDVNRRIDDVNRRFDDVNRKFDDLRFWLQFILGVQVLIISGLVVQWLLMWKRIIGTEKLLHTHLAEKEERELISLQREEIKLLKDRLSRLEGISA